jgi:AhpC/TSA family
MVSGLLALVVALAFAAAPLTATPMAATDIDGKSWTLFAPAAHQLDLLFFVAADCPISNRYAPEIARICRDYSSRGVRCFMVYPDAAVEAAAVAKHRGDYGLGSTPAIIDRRHQLVDAVGSRVTPEAALYSSAGRVYRGRIDDWYIDVSRARLQANRHDLRLALDATLAGRPVAQPETEAVGCFIVAPPTSSR